MKKLIIAMPGWLLCGLIYLLQVENKHFGFENPGISDSVGMIVLLSILTLGYASIALFLNHKDKLDLLLQYITLFLVIKRLIQIIFLFSKYYWAQ
jgi:hypothetical protein